MDLKIRTNTMSALILLPILLGGCSLSSDGESTSPRRIKSIGLYYYDKAETLKAEADESWSFSYDGAGDITEILSSYKEGTHPVAYFQQNLHWNAGRISAYEEQVIKNARWVLDYRRSFVYDHQGRLIKRTAFKPGGYHNGFSWEYNKAPAYSIKREYQISDLSESVIYPRPELDEYYRISYDGRMRELRRIEYTKDESSGEMVTVEKTEKHWNPAALEAETIYRWNDGGWTQSRMTEYDEHGYMIRFTKGSDSFEYEFQRSGDIFPRVLARSKGKPAALFIVSHEAGPLSEAGRRYFRGQEGPTSPFYSF